MQFNESYFEDLLTSAPVEQLVKSKADAIAARARATAPVDTGAYKASIVVRKKRAAKRSVFLVVASDPKTMIIESKTGNLVRALKSVVR